MSSEIRRHARSPAATRAALVALTTLILPAAASADVVVRNQAMLATTIVEAFVHPDRVTVDLEVGLADLEAFRNLLPDDLYEMLGQAPVPLRERLTRFFREDLVITAGDGEPLPGRVLEIGSRARVRRDEITGEPLPVIGDEEENVVFARLEYALDGKPETLNLLAPRGPRPANVGFVVYHEGIPVNDFRYLAASQTLDLDWSDPWYSRFRSRALRRQYFEPMSGFLYVEPYEVRKEIVLRPLDLQHWVDLGLADRKTIPVEIQEELKRSVAAFLREHHPVEIDGRRIDPELARVNFLERTLKTSRVIDPPRELDVHSAILGVIFVYPTDGLPDRVTMDWDLWSERIQQIPAASVDQAGALPVYLEPDFRLLEWRNFLKNPVLPTLRVLAPPPSALERALLLLRWVLLAATLAVGGWCLRDPRRRVAATALVLVVTGASFWASRNAALSDSRAREVVSGLLHNVYRAFDFRKEEEIYDVLAKSVEGDLLARIYLETRRGLELANQGGARAKVKEIELVDLAAEPGKDGGFVATATWNVAGSVGHWGHVHQRRNRYRAELDVAAVDGAWKLVDLEILQEERL
jgi:hypothetical protein